ncbi:hypothetical protein N8T08_004341 [Aspergillus melleus]|uniref:Uncharacterized protein n=1 Tax=Aspergillus melleus TaxID=138277 RepID=A0ACC3B5D8_9EURO|nr:hypothetical protein N8T08_004341 [Aspergillus melleus]
MPAAYQIFRKGVTAASRLTMATKIADFIKEHDLDGVDIDWEYPGAPDIPGIEPGSPDEGRNYLVFLVVLKNLLPGKSISIAAPSSYWYLKQFPIKEIAKIVDYIVYMAYTKQSLAMVTKVFIELASPGEDPKTDQTRNGNWTDFDCTHPLVVNFADYTPSEQWKGLNAEAVWRDMVRIWKETDIDHKYPKGL